MLWRRQESNLRLVACEATTLPLSYTPYKTDHIIQWRGIEPPTSAVLKPRHNQLDHLCTFSYNCATQPHHAVRDSCHYPVSDSSQFVHIPIPLPILISNYAHEKTKTKTKTKTSQPLPPIMLTKKQKHHNHSLLSPYFQLTFRSSTQTLLKLIIGSYY